MFKTNSIHKVKKVSYNRCGDELLRFPGVRWKWNLRNEGKWEKNMHAMYTVITFHLEAAMRKHCLRHLLLAVKLSGVLWDGTYLIFCQWWRHKRIASSALEETVGFHTDLSGACWCWLESISPPSFFPDFRIACGNQDTSVAPPAKPPFL